MTTAEAPPFEQGDCYKYQWARHVARKTLHDDLRGVRALINQMKNADGGSGPGSGLLVPDLPADTSINDLYKLTEKATGGGLTPPDPARFNVGIVGAGAAGLFTALLFDWLNGHPEVRDQLHIDYDVLEANGADRLGGRLFTHRFSDDEHDYYDVGAMRFPDNNIMSRTFRLLDYLNIKRGRKGRIEYYFDDAKGVCPTNFNNIGKIGNVYPRSPPQPPAVFDPFELNSGLPENDRIPDNLVATKPDDVAKAAIQTITHDVRQILDKQRTAKNDSSVDESQLWATLMSLDKMSVRQFFSSTDNGTDSQGKPLPKGPGYNFNTCEWIECATFATGWYDQALTELVLETLDFETKEGEKFWCIDGGVQKIARLMGDKMEGSVHFKTQVTAINANIGQRGPDRTKYAPLTLAYTKTDPISKQSTQGTRDYVAVFNSTPLGALQRMDLRDAGLLWGTKQAIRALYYSAATKVAIKFRTPWWQLPPFNIDQGGIAHTDMPLRACVYPSYNIQSPCNPDWRPDEPAVLLCSFTWAQDALRLGALIRDKSPDGEDELRRLMLHDLAVLHARDEMPYEVLIKKLEDEYMTHHAWDWYRDPHAAGAFAFFGPGQFSNMWQEIIKPNAFCQLYLVSEAASAHHSWVVGALESVVRAVYVLFQSLQAGNPEFAPYATVLRLLREDNKDEAFPFYPLPSEMPHRQFETDRGVPLTDLPGGDSGEAELSYAAAVAALSQMESLLETQYEAMAA